MKKYLKFMPLALVVGLVACSGGRVISLEDGIKILNDIKKKQAAEDWAEPTKFTFEYSLETYSTDPDDKNTDEMILTLDEDNKQIYSYINSYRQEGTNEPVKTVGEQWVYVDGDSVYALVDTNGVKQIQTATADYFDTVANSLKSAKEYALNGMDNPDIYITMLMDLLKDSLGFETSTASEDENTVESIKISSSSNGNITIENSATVKMEINSMSDSSTTTSTVEMNGSAKITFDNYRFAFYETNVEYSTGEYVKASMKISYNAQITIPDKSEFETSSSEESSSSEETSSSIEPTTTAE
ncbi:MAG: hypothetical protein LBM03_00320 [Erysipelotrichaceae bacterium]|jgi:hypothetical protein|nr:hypothetical protein [Erysipelotrichaceae bacterium]